MVNSDYVKHHEWTHLGEKPFGCDKCEYRCNNQRRLEIHMIKHETERTEVQLIHIHQILRKKFKNWFRSYKGETIGN